MPWAPSACCDLAKLDEKCHCCTVAAASCSGWLLAGVVTEEWRGVVVLRSRFSARRVSISHRSRCFREYLHLSVQMLGIHMSYICV